MHGRPITEWIVFLVFWLALLAPVAQLTGRGPNRQPPAPAPATAAVEIQTDARLLVSTLPRSIRVRQGARVLWELREPVDASLITSFPLTREEDVAELWVEATWPDGAARPRVLELILAPDGLRELSRHAWTHDNLDEVFVYEWGE